ncbi:glutaredoxin family protein [Nostoc sp. CENA67]|uniref:Glutaredoxin family protein n=1 Tax=Amazonocrinis nigriterrae CENA67 TaxID=2794033 RepID=A0A8J7HPA0_9NOST|nr:glutaredoxin family protein [Amazonocrinis nigriterrae]MBH8563381.1 glutaredoxin family protein [Amazonocrinis nigriterrae CENA67]
MRLILYSKPGCHLCEGLQEKLEQIQNLSFELEIRDITIREDWYQAYQYEVPVLYLSNRPSGTLREPLRGTPVPHLGRSQDGDWTHQDAEGTEEGVTEEPLPRPSPRATVQQLEQMLCKYISKNKKNNAE